MPALSFITNSPKNRTKQPIMVNIVFLALPQSLASSLALPMEMLQAAASHQRLRRQPASLQLQVVSEGGLDIEMSGGLSIKSHGDYRDIDRCDLLIIPPRWRHPLRGIRDNADLFAWLRRIAGSGARICAVSNGSFLMAEAGLLNGMAATTHWAYFDTFETAYPKVDLKRQYLLTEDSGLYCAGSINTVADLMVHQISAFWDRDLGQKVAQQFSPEIRRPFETLAFRRQNRNLHQDEAMASIQAQMQSAPERNWTTEELAALVDMSARNLSRRFQRATGQTIKQYLLALRLQLAMDWLRHSDLSIADIAAQLGFGDSSYFSKCFRQHFSESPGHYRRQSRGKLFSVDPDQINDQ